MMTTGQIPERQAVEGAILTMAMTMTTVRVSRTRKAVRNGPWTGRVQRMGTGKGRGRQPRKGRGRGREMVKGKVLSTKPEEEMISLGPLLVSCRRNCMSQTRTRRAN